MSDRVRRGLLGGGSGEGGGGGAELHTRKPAVVGSSGTSPICKEHRGACKRVGRGSWSALRSFVGMACFAGMSRKETQGQCGGVVRDAPDLQTHMQVRRMPAMCFHALQHQASNKMHRTMPLRRKADMRAHAACHPPPAPLLTMIHQKLYSPPQPDARCSRRGHCTTPSVPPVIPQSPVQPSMLTCEEDMGGKGGSDYIRDAVMLPWDAVLIAVHRLLPQCIFWQPMPSPFTACRAPTHPPPTPHAHRRVTHR